MNSNHTFWCVGAASTGEVKEGATYAALYDTVITLLSKGHAVIYAVENDVNKTVVNISKIETAAEDYIESGALTIVNSDFLYAVSKRGVECDKLLSRWQAVVSSLKSKGFKTILVVGMPDRSLFAGNKGQLGVVESEECMAKMENGSVRIFCCYPKSMMDKLPFHYLVRLLNAHQDMASRSGLSQVLLSQRSNDHLNLMALVEQGLRASLGEETSLLVLKTMKLVYKLDQKDIIHSPELFEEKVRRLFGATGDAVLRMLTSSIVEKIAGNETPI